MRSAYTSVVPEPSSSLVWSFLIFCVEDVLFLRVMPLLRRVVRVSPSFILSPINPISQIRILCYWVEICNFLFKVFSYSINLTYSNCIGTISALRVNIDIPYRNW